MFNKERKNLLSVIICLYNYPFQKNLIATLKSIRNQNLNVEIVISEQAISKESEYRQIAKKFKAKYILTKPDISDGKILFNMGRIRNAGALASTGKYLYFSDADILIYNKDYLKILMVESAKINKYNWYKPSMYRLSESTYGEFIQDYLDNKKIDIPDLPNTCLVDYDKCTNTLKPINGGEHNNTILDQPFVCTKKEFDMINSEDFDLSKTDELIWKASFHYGGTFCSFNNFYDIGGYCELYYNWGVDDEDFHLKLKSMNGIEQIDKIVPNKSMLHFEHKKKHNNTEYYKQNIKIYEERRTLKIDKVIEFDKNNEKSLIGAYIKNDINSMKSFIIS